MATGGTVSYRGRGGHRELAFHVPEWRAHMPRCAWRRHMTNFSKSSAAIPPPYPAASRRSADGQRIAPDRLDHNPTVTVLHNFNETVENDSRYAGKIRRAKVRASSAGILQEDRQACVPGDGASSFLADVEAGIELCNSVMRDYGSRYAAQRNAGAPAPMRPSARPGFAYHRRERPIPEVRTC